MSEKPQLRKFEYNSRPLQSLFSVALFVLLALVIPGMLIYEMNNYEHFGLPALSDIPINANWIIAGGISCLFLYLTGLGIFELFRYAIHGRQFIEITDNYFSIPTKTSDPVKISYNSVHNIEKTDVKGTVFYTFHFDNKKIELTDAKFQSKNDYLTAVDLIISKCSESNENMKSFDISNKAKAVRRK